MKRFILFLGLWILIISSLIYAEGLGRYAVKFGVGVSSEAFNGAQGLFNEDDYENRPGVNFGVSATLSQHKQFQFFGEMQYQVRGSELKLFYTDVNGNPIKQEPGLDNLFEYLVFSSGVNFTFGNGKMRPFLKAGPSLNLLLRERSSFGDLNFNTSRFVFGAALGGGLVFAKLPPGELFVEIKYDLDVTKALETDPTLPNKFDMKHRVLSVSLGLLLP